MPFTVQKEGNEVLGTEEEKLARKRKNARLRQQKKRSLETPEQKSARNASNAARQVKNRSMKQFNMTPAKTEEGPAHNLGLQHRPDMSLTKDNKEQPARHSMEDERGEVPERMQSFHQLGLQHRPDMSLTKGNNGMACDESLDQEGAHKDMSLTKGNNGTARKKNSIREELMIYPVDMRFLNEVEKQFDITRMVGSGTFGEVYAAYDRVNGRRVAIKRLLPFHRLDAYKEEQRFISSLNGKSNIVQIVKCPPLAPDGIILIEEQQALIFEYLEHDRPSVYVKDLTMKEIAHYMKNLFLALSSVHALGIIHRDVKLNNFLYDRRNKKYLLVDFGLAEKKMQTTALGISKEQSPSSGRSLGNILPCEVSTASTRSSRNEKEQEKLDMAQQIAKRRMLGVTKTNASVTVRNSGVKVNRGGTRGYREVLMGSQFQTTAVDVWAAGVVLLTLLCRTTHFQWFRHDDLTSATMEIYWYARGVSKCAGLTVWAACACTSRAWMLCGSTTMGIRVSTEIRSEMLSKISSSTLRQNCCRRRCCIKRMRMRVIWRREA